MKTKRSPKSKAQPATKAVATKAKATKDKKSRPAGIRKAGANTARGRAPSRETRKLGTPPGHAPATTPVRRPAPAKNASQAKARAKARKAKAPKIVRVPLRERLITRLEWVDLRPRVLAARVPFVVLVIGALGLGLGVTLWLSTDAAERSYQLGTAHQTNEVLLQQKEALERDVLEAQAAPALAEAARSLGMIPSRDTAHLVQDPAGNWVVVGSPKPAEGAPPPPLNALLPEDIPAPRPGPVPAAQDPAAALERPVRITPGATAVPLAAGPEVPVRVPAPATLPGPALDPEHAPAGLPVVPGQPFVAPLPGPDPAAVQPLPIDPAIVPPAPPAPPAMLPGPPA